MHDIIRTQGQWVRDSGSMDPALGLILVVAGLVYALMGWRVFKALIIVNCAALGALVGSGIGMAVDSSSWMVPVVAGLVGAAILGSLSLPLFKAGVVLCGVLVGGFVGIMVTSVFSGSEQMQLVGGVVGSLVAASLVFVVFQHVVMFILSLQGSLMAVAGVLAAISDQPGFFRHLRENAATTDWLVPFCVIALTITGVCVQMAGSRESAGST